MAYTYTFVDNSNYIAHFNKNHDKSGRFAIGDGDGDGTRDDHHAKQDKATTSKKVKLKYDRAALGVNYALDASLIGLSTYNLAVGLITQNYAKVALGGIGLAAGTVYAGIDFVNTKRVLNAEKVLNDIEKLKSESSGG
jgi:hypothetical protein